MTGAVVEKEAEVPGSVADREGPGRDREAFCWRRASLLVKASTVDDGEPGTGPEGFWVNISDDDGEGKASDPAADEGV